MSNIQIAILNHSTVLTDTQVQAVVPALQTQVTDHFAPVWGIHADLTFVPHGQSPAPGTWWLVILDHSDHQGALGYHFNDLTTQGLPMGKVFAGTDIQSGSSWTVTLSHELLEMLGDPDINLCAANPQPNGLRFFAYEVADACESDQYGYYINGVLVTDFVYPAWFESFRQPNSTQFDHHNLIHQPFWLLPGGFISIYDVHSGSGWTQLQAETAPITRDMRARVGSRRERRRVPRAHWMRSVKADQAG